MNILGRTTQHKGSFAIVNQVAYLCATQSKREQYLFHNLNTIFKVMSSRRDEFKSGSSNPAKRYLEWDSNAGGFKFYDKEKGQNVPVKSPFKFVVLKTLHTVKGWHGKSESGIYSNEVTDMNQILNVKSFKGGHLVSGLYRDIKDKLQGGVYFKSIYVMLADGSVANIALKGASCAAWGDFTKKTANRLPDEWVAVMGASEQRNGSVKYTVPTFEFKGSLKAEEGQMADEAYDSLKGYLNDYLSRKPEDNAPSEEELLQDEQPSKTAHLETPQAKASSAPLDLNEDSYELPF
jgi:hypothetical protein